MTGFESLAPALAEVLMVKRLAAKLSQQEVADATGIPRSGVSDVERGLREVSALELKAYAVLFGTTTDALLGHEVPEPAIGTSEGLVARLEKVTADLNGYLEQRARELAAPQIEMAEEAAAARVHQAEEQLRQRNDLVAELRRQLTAAWRGQARDRHAAGLRHDKEYCEHCKTETVVVLR